MRLRKLAMFLAIPILAETLSADAAKVQGLLMALGSNSKQMKSYQWKQRITVFRKGDPTEPILEEVRFDSSGQLQRITLAKPEPKRMGPIRSRKAAEIKESIQEVMQLAARYTHPQTLGQAIQKGEIWEGQGSLRVQGRSIVLPVDEITLRVDGATFVATRLDCRTAHENNPVTISADYQRLPNGPSVMTRMTVQMPKEHVVIQVESFDHVQLARPAAF